MKACKERELSASTSGEGHEMIPRQDSAGNINVVNAVEVVQRNAGLLMQWQNAFPYNV